MLVADILMGPARMWHEMFTGLLDDDDTHELTRSGDPTILVCGDDDALVAREMQSVLADRIPDAELTPTVESAPRFPRMPAGHDAVLKPMNKPVTLRTMCVAMWQ